MVAVDVDFFHHRKSDAVVFLAERTDFGIAARVLCAELVAGKPQNRQSALALGVVQLFLAGELRCEAAGTRGVDDQNNLAAVIRQAYRRASDAAGVKIINGRHAHGSFLL